MKPLKMTGLAAVLLATAACAQNGKQAPEKVKSAFTQKFPTAKAVKWDKENDAEWEAEFKMNGTEYSANFTNDGTWKETEHEIKNSEIPAAVKNTLDTEFAGYEMEEAEISETATGMLYEFELEKGEVKMEVGIDANGKVVKKETKTEKDEKDDSEEDDD